MINIVLKLKISVMDGLKTRKTKNVTCILKFNICGKTNIWVLNLDKLIIWY